MTENGHFRAYGPSKKLSQGTLDLIHACNHILDQYAAKGYAMTLRQLYYQMVARGLTEGINTKAMYERIGNALNEGRMQGLVSWTALEDRGRNLQGVATYTSPAQLLRNAKASYATDLWADQPWRPEVWVEKEALIGVIGSICQKLRVDFFATKGYNSQSEQWRAGQRFAGYVQKGQRPIVFHLGDHDPSGIDMTRDNQKRLSLFAGTPIIVQRLALNMPQIEEFNPPPNYAKETDSRHSAYVEKYGDLSWELDALDPEYIEKLIRDAVLRVRNEELFDAALAQENADIAELNLVIEQMGDI